MIGSEKVWECKNGTDILYQRAVWWRSVAAWRLEMEMFGVFFHVFVCHA